MGKRELTPSAAEKDFWLLEKEEDFKIKFSGNPNPKLF